MKKKIILILGIIAVFIIILITAFDTRLKIVNYKLKSSEVADDIKLVLVTDLHSCYYGENQSDLLKKIERYNPDAVLLGGDIFDDIMDNTNSRIFIEGLTQKYKTYYVSGNHEWWSGKMYELFDYITSKGVNILRGNSDLLNAGNTTINICGIDDPEVNVYDGTHLSFEGQLDNIGQSLKDNCFNLLLTHRPECAEQYFNYDFDVVLSGHAHGGQFRVPFIINGLYAPNQGFFPELAGGMYDFDGSKLIVSRGLSRENSSLPRIFNRPELVFITLSPEQ